MANWLARIFGSRNQRLIGQYSGSVKKINALERLKAVSTPTMPYPGFPTDMQAQLMAMM